MISIKLEKEDPSYLPGETIRGRVVWTLLQTKTQRLDLELGWSTIGRGSVDEEIVFSLSMDPTSDKGSWDFEIIAPLRPYSFSGTLISLQWTLRVSESPGQNFIATNIVISPKSAPIILPPIDSEFDLANRWKMTRK